MYSAFSCINIQIFPVFGNGRKKSSKYVLVMISILRDHRYFSLKKEKHPHLLPIWSIYSLYVYLCNPVPLQWALVLIHHLETTNLVNKNKKFLTGLFCGVSKPCWTTLWIMCWYKSCYLRLFNAFFAKPPIVSSQYTKGVNQQ